MLFGISCLLIAGVVYLKERGAPAAPTVAVVSPQPVYGWVNMWSNRLTIGAGRFTTLHILQTDKARITVKSEDPVNFGVVAQQVDTSSLTTFDFGQLACAETQVVETTRECDVPNRKAFLLVNYPGTRPHLVFDVKIEAWRCTANCPQANRQ
ncbi:MAG TPA: hypothetical protein VF840_09035 [Terriglobales bacterium]